MSSATSYVLIGGYAAIHAARAIRERDKNGRITLVNAEKWAPYCSNQVGLTSNP